MIIQLKDLERKVLSLKELDLSRQEVLKRTRSYVDLCVDISTFQELKEIVFKHIPKKTYSITPRKKYEWVETRNDGVEHIHYNYWKDLPKQVRFQIIKWKRYKKVRLHSNDNPKHQTKGYQSTPKNILKQGKDTYCVDKNTKKVFKLKEGEFYSSDILKLKILPDYTITSEKAKKLYKKQNQPKPLVKKQIIKLKASKAIVPKKTFLAYNMNKYSLAYNSKTEIYSTDISKANKNDTLFKYVLWHEVPREFRKHLTKKPVGLVLTEEGRKQKTAFYTKTKKGKSIPNIITLVDEVTIDYTLPPKGEERKSKFLAPPTINLKKQEIRDTKKANKVKYAHHKIELGRAISKKKRFKGVKKLVKNIFNARLKFVESLGIITTRSKIADEVKKQHLKDLKKRRFNKLVVRPKIEKETKISTYQSKRSAKIKTAWEIKTKKLKKHLRQTHNIFNSKRYNELSTYYKDKKENDTKRNNKR